jgi:hypothetical protein
MIMARLFKYGIEWVVFTGILGISHQTQASTTLVAQSNGHCLAISGSSKKSGAAVVESSCTQGSSYQQFALNPNGPGTYSIQNVASSLCLEPSGSAQTLVQVACNSGYTSQQFTVDPVAGSSSLYTLVFSQSGNCVTSPSLGPTSCTTQAKSVSTQEFALSLSASPAPTSSPTASPTSSPSPSSSPTGTPPLFSDNFSQDATGICTADSDTFGSPVWVDQWGGGGTCPVSVVELPSSIGSGHALYESPTEPSSAGITSSLVTSSSSFSGNITFQTSIYTSKALLGSSALAALGGEDWDVAWLFWDYRVNTAASPASNETGYYLYLGTAGWELGKMIPSANGNEVGNQVYFVDGSNPLSNANSSGGFPIDTWYDVTIKQVANSAGTTTITVSVNGNELGSYIDTGYYNSTSYSGEPSPGNGINYVAPYTSGNIGLYNEDSDAYFQAVSVTSP